MKFRWVLIGLMAGLIGCSQTHMAKDKEEEDEGNEVKMTIDQVPPAVRATLLQQADGATIKTIDQEHPKSGKVVYETDVMQGGKNREIRVDENGKLISNKIDMEEGEKPAKKEKDEEDEKDEKK